MTQILFIFSSITYLLTRITPYWYQKSTVKKITVSSSFFRMGNYLKGGIYIVILIHFSLSQVSGQSITISNDTTICLGGTATLNATIIGGTYGTASYSFEVI